MTDRRFILLGRTSIKRCITGYECIGIGEYLGHFLIRKMYHPNMTTNEAAVIALYTIGSAKHYVHDCGGSTSVAILTNDGVLDESLSLISKATDTIDKILAEYDHETQKLLVSLMNDEDTEFYKVLIDFAKALRGSRFV